MGYFIMIGIYKITNPLGQIYIGQSKDVEVRRKFHLCKGNKSHGRLGVSFLNHGAINHYFELVEECQLEQLNERERYWQDYYDVLGDGGLNETLTKTLDKKFIKSQRVIDKVSLSRIGVYAGEDNHNSKLVLNTVTGIYYISCMEASEYHNITDCYLRGMLSGHVKNKTDLIYV